MEIAGIDAAQIVNDLMALERQPLLAIEERQDEAEAAAQALTTLRSSVDSVRFAADRLAGATAFSRFTASSSSSTVTASASETSAPASLSFTVSQLAANHGLRSVNTVASSDTVVTSATSLSVLIGGASHGVGLVRAGAGLTAGDHDLQITQASAAATKRSDSAVAGATLAASEYVDVTVNGSSTSIEIVAGTYTAEQLATAVDQGLTNAGLDASAALDTDGHLVITTGREGSDASIQVTGGSGLARVGLSVDATATTGTDAVVTVGDQTTTLTTLDAGSTVTVTTPEGDLELDLTGGLRVGTLDVTTVDVGGGTLSEVATAINQANGGISAAAVRVDDDAWRLQLSSRTAGEDGEIVIDTSLFSSMGGMIESSPARNAEIVIGEGAGAYTVESSSNTFSDVLGGTSITVSEVSATPVTVNVARNDTALAADVSSLVSAMNTALAEIRVQTRYGVDGLGDGALAGNSTVRRMVDQLRIALSYPVDGVTDMVGADVGIQSTSDGSFTFDQGAFMSAVAEDPAAVARYFGRAATTPADVSFLDATAETVSGSYDVEVTTAATQATSARVFDGGASTATKVGVRVGDLTATVDVSAGASAAQIIDALNAAFADTGLDLVAEADATGLVVRADAWGSGGDFELNLDVDGVGTWDAVAGTDVAGTIDGVAATGIGRSLSLSSLADSNAAGLSLQIAGGVSGSLGSVDYQPGLAARVVEVTTQLTGDDGAFDSADDAQQRRIDDFNDQIDRFELRLALREETLIRQWSSLQTLLAGLQEQSSWLASQIETLPKIETN